MGRCGIIGQQKEVIEVQLMELVELSKKREAAREQLITAVNELTDALLDVLRPGDFVEVEGQKFGVLRYTSNLGDRDFFVISSEWGGPRVFGCKRPGGSFYLHGDYHAYVMVADLDDYINFARLADEIIKAFKQKLGSEIETIQKLLARWGELAKEVGNENA